MEAQFAQLEALLASMASIMVALVKSNVLMLIRMPQDQIDISSFNLDP
jgi:hypothetical protein